MRRAVIDAEIALALAGVGREIERAGAEGDPVVFRRLQALVEREPESSAQFVAVEVLRSLGRRAEDWEHVGEKIEK